MLQGSCIILSDSGTQFLSPGLPPTQPRERDRMPLPQVAEQVDHSPQGPQKAGTIKKER